MAAAYSNGVPTSSEPRAGNVYLIEERRPKAAFELFEQAMSSGHAGMVVTRECPKKLMTDKGLSTCRVVWMTNLVGEGRINPTAIGILMSQVRSFIDGQRKSVVMIDGLEYLITVNTYDRMLQFMHQLRDIVATNESILLVPLDPRTVSERELALLERNMETVIPRVEVDVQDEPMLAHQTGELRVLGIGPR